MIRHPCPCDCFPCRQYTRWLETQEIGPTDEEIEKMVREIEQIKRLENKSINKENICEQ